MKKIIKTEINYNFKVFIINPFYYIIYKGIILYKTYYIIYLIIISN